MEIIHSKQAYDRFCNGNNTVPLFYQPEYLDAVCGADQWQVLMCVDKEGTVYGIMPFHIRKKYGMTVILQPKLTPYSGPYLYFPRNIEKDERINAFSKKVINLLYDALPKHTIYRVNMHHQIRDWQPLMWKGYRQTTKYTYIIDTKPEISTLLGNLRSEARNQLKKAEQELILSETNDVSILYDLCKETFIRQEKTISFSQKLTADIYNTLAPKQQAKIFQVKDDQGDLQAAMMFVNDQQYMYGLITGKRTKAHSGAVTMLLWQGIMLAKCMNLQYDFEGSDLPHIEPLYRSFGGVQTPYFSIHHSGSRIIDAILLLTNKL